MKTLTLGTLLTSMWQSPVIALLIIVALVFITDLLNQYLENKKITCVSTNWDAYSYKDIQAYAKANNIRANQKKQTLINSLQGV